MESSPFCFGLENHMFAAQTAQSISHDFVTLFKKSWKHCGFEAKPKCVGRSYPTSQGTFYTTVWVSETFNLFRCRPALAPTPRRGLSRFSGIRSPRGGSWKTSETATRQQ